jgi:S-adenosylmethionine hydrolase
VLQGALVLANTLPYMPPGVHLAVVDPGVGSARRPLALEDAQGRLYVGPDNGLLLPAADRFGGLHAAHELANPAYARSPVSRTFHGRDLFAPAAAHLARGVPLDDLGPPVAPDALVRLELPQPELDGEAVVATVLYVDRFGNVQLNLRREHLLAARIEPGTPIAFELGGRTGEAVAALTFTDAGPGAAILYEDSYGNVSLAVSQGNAAERFGVDRGQAVRIRPGRP